MTLTSVEGSRPAKQRSGSRQGSSLLEFALLTPLLFLLTFGSLVVGMVVDRYITVLQVVRNAGNMYARGVDFSIATNQQLLLMSAAGLGMTTTSGAGVIYLSTLAKAPVGTANANRLVITERFAIGERTLASSKIGTPLAWNSTTGKVTDFNNQGSAVATNMPAAFAAIGSNERVVAVEVYHNPVDLSRSQFPIPLRVMYNRAFF